MTLRASASLWRAIVQSVSWSSIHKPTRLFGARRRAETTCTKRVSIGGRRARARTECAVSTGELSLGLVLLCPIGLVN